MRYSEYNLTVDERWAWEKLKNKRFLLGFVRSEWQDGWEAIQTTGVGAGGRALVLVSGVRYVSRHPGGNVTQNNGCVSGRQRRWEGCLSMS